MIGVFSIEKILKFTKYTKRLIIGFDENNEPIYNDEIQREVEPSRVKNIAHFLIDDPEATFPTNIVLHIPIEVIVSQTKNDKTVEIELSEAVFEEIRNKNGDVFISIIDGQHRIKGIEVAIERLDQQITSLQQTLVKASENKELLKKFDYYVQRLKDLKSIELVVSFFIDKSLEYQAMIFSTINRTQKRVSQNLVYSLFGLTTNDSPQKTALQIVLALNGHPESPFYKRIKFYGNSYDRNTSPPLSQAMMVKKIISLISENLGESERDRFKERKKLLKRSEGSQKFLPFRKLYAKKLDDKISDLFFYFFKSVEKNFKIDESSYWDLDIEEDSTPKNIFHTAVGFDSLMKILIDILEIEQDDIEQIASTKVFDKYLAKASNLRISDTNRYPFNNRGKKTLYLDLSLAIWPPEKNNDARLLELEKTLGENA